MTNESIKREMIVNDFQRLKIKYSLTKKKSFSKNNQIKINYNN